MGGVYGDREPESVRWWDGAVGYEVYIRSFADASGDGVGDLAGLTERLDHIAALGADIVWVTPFYRSPMVDYGYDVADYIDVDPQFGTVADVERLADETHRLGMRLVVDIVPNHCSTQHRWFREAVTDPTGPYRDYFIWRDPAPDGGPPNNWIGYFGGSAWTLEPDSNQYYLHLFLPEQADLNWRNPAVLDEFDDILRFWLDRGVDGFRIDVAQAMVKDAALRDNPQVAHWDPGAPRWEQWNAFDHRYDVGQPETMDVFARWHQVVEPYGGVLIGETYVLDADELARMLRGDALDIGFWFEPMHIEWSAAEIRSTLERPLAAVEDPTKIGWVASSHDEVRPPSRFGGGDLGRGRALAFSTLLLSLPGVPFLYQGEELGLLEGVVPEDRKADPVGADVSMSRDGCRTPMPWEPGPNFGFSRAAASWLPDGGREPGDTAAVQRADAGSWFHRYRALIELRHAEPDLRGGTVGWIEHAAPEVLAIRRGELVVLCNVGDEPAPVGVRGQVRYATTGRGGIVTEADALAPAEAIVVRVDESPAREVDVT